MVRRFVGAVLIAASGSATSAFAASSAAHAALSQNPVAPPRDVVLVPPPIFAFARSALGHIGRHQDAASLEFARHGDRAASARDENAPDAVVSLAHSLYPTWPVER